MKIQKNEDNNFKKNFNEIRKNHSKNKKTYIALGICLVTVSAIAWSTYQSVNTFISPFRNSSETKSSSKASKSINSETNKNTILGDDDESKSNPKNGKPIPYGKPKGQKSKDFENPEEKAQPVSAAPSNFQIVYPTENGNVLKEFSEGKPVYSETLGDWRSHDGVDFIAETGSKVKSVAEGVVKDVYQDPSYGTTVTIEHSSGFLAYYSGLDEKNLIEKGKKVTPGETIGIVGKIPCEISDPPHIHFSIFKDSKFINPITMLKKEKE